MRDRLKAPFPYFGGKSQVASLVWERLGDADNYVEPFFGSGAVLLLRPHAGRVETVNDADCYLANFWRATQRDPEAVAAHADGPVNEADLHARHRWLVLSDHAAEFRRLMRSDPDHFDAQVAGWWCWGLCCWIGSGWCVEPRPGGRLPEGRPTVEQCATGGKGVHGVLPEQLPHLDRGSGRGIHAAPGLSDQMPLVSRPGVGMDADAGLSAKLPDMEGRGMDAAARPQGGRRPVIAAPGSANGLGVHSGDSGKRVKLSGGSPGSGALGTGVHANGPTGKEGRPQLADAFARGRGVHGRDEAGTCAQRRAWMLDWFSRLRDRLRPVRVCCGDWSRVCSSESTTTRLGRTGVFLDPPYPKKRKCGRKSRAGHLYATDRTGAKSPEQLRDEVLAWAEKVGPDPLMRVVIAGYEGDGYEALEARGWAVDAWKANGGYGNRGAEGLENAQRERLWCSPHCRREQPGLFDHLPLAREEPENQP